MKKEAVWKLIIEGVIFSFQLLSTVPLKKQIQYDQTRVRISIISYPIVGVFLGLLLFGIMIAFFGNVSNLVLSLLILTVSVIYSGGLHLDGWMDCSDAFFSYKDQEKKLEIMKDSRIGAFAAISVIMLLVWKFVFIYEIISVLKREEFLIIAFIPIFARFILGLKLYFGQLARKEGMAYAMQRYLMKKDSILYGIMLAVFLFLVYFLVSSIFFIVVTLVISSIFFLFFSTSFDRRHFGGLTGDTLGASVEGSELWLWMTLYLLLSFGTG